MQRYLSLDYIWHFFMCRVKIKSFIAFYCIVLLLCLCMSKGLFALQADVDNVASLKDYIQSEYKRVYPEISISSVSLVVRDTLPLYDIEIITKNLNSLKGASGYLTLTYKYNNKVLQENIRYNLSATINLYVASENIRANSNFNEKSFIAKTQDFSTITIIPASKFEILNSSAKAAIPVNTIIYKNKLAKKILVTKDSNVKIIFHADGIEASMFGRALENGVQGDNIKVENIESKKVITAEVIDSSLVRIR